MSLPFPQHEGHAQPLERKEPMPLSEVLSGSVFVSATGRVYRLFGNEDESYTLPSIPPIPALSIPPLPILFESAFIEPETAAVPASEKMIEQQCSTLSISSNTRISIPLPPFSKNQESHQSADSSTIQRVHVTRESLTPKFLLQEGIPAQATISIREIASGVMLPSQDKKNRIKKNSKPFCDISQDNTENCIIPFVKPAPISAMLKRGSETKNLTLKMVQERKPLVFTVPVKYLYLWENTFQKSQQRCRLALWKRCCSRSKKSFDSLVLSIAETFPEELPIQDTPSKNNDVQNREPNLSGYDCSFEDAVISDGKRHESQNTIEKTHRSPLVLDRQTARWSDQIDSLMQSASNQIQMLADHLTVQFHQGIKTICFKSIFPCDGCSTILLCAVKAMLDRHFRILLVDAHHQHIDLPHRFHLLHHDDMGNRVLTIQESLGLWAVQKSKTEEENWAALARIIAANKEKYDMILIDSGSLTESPLQELVQFWKQINLDGIVLVSDAKRSAEISLSYITDRLRHNHIHLVGIAENYV